MKHLFTLSLCFLALSLSVYGQVPDYIPTDGLVAWYPFNGNANDESGNELHGVAQDVTYDNSSCQGAQVVRNDGSGVVEIPNNVISPYSLTIAGRFTLNTLGDQTLFRNGNGGEMHVVYNQFQDNQIRFSMKFSNNQWVSAGVELPFLDEWYSFVATYNTYEDKLSIYLSSGESEIVDTPDTGLWNYSIPTQISRYCNGDVDEISLWSRDLNENEISFYLNNLSCESCADVLACNYYPNSIDNVDCDYSCCPGPGCCGVGMNWNSEIGECEITNPTDTNLDGCTNLTDLMDILSAYGDCSASEFTCGDPLEYQGYDYETVQIGEQCWFAENARYLPAISPPNDGSEQDGMPHGYVYDYLGHNVEEAQEHPNYQEYGGLYNLQAVLEWELCPTGWHVPNTQDWHILFNEYGGISIAGPPLMSTYGWDDDGNGTNLSGFNGKPAGDRNVPNVTFYSQGRYGFFWTTDLEAAGAACFILRTQGEGEAIGEMIYPADFGISVRCIKD